jgi:hypothetical protein
MEDTMETKDMSNEEIIGQAVNCDCDELNESQILARREISYRLETASKAKEILLDAKETIEYCKLYVENRGLSAEDDCNISLKLINDFLGR